LKFRPHPQIALSKADFNPKIHKTFYRYNYARIFEDIANKKLDAIRTYRQLLLDDLFFMVCFGMQIEKANHPFVVKQCRVVQDGPTTDTLDVWARYHFKALDVNEPILTVSGWKKHGDLTIGDSVFHPSGKVTNVIAKTEVFTDAPCKKITFTDGYSVVVSAQHLWRVLRKIRRRIPHSEKRFIEFVPEVVDTYNLKVGDDVGITSAIQYPEAQLPIPPYTFGAWLGDGTSNGGSITTAYSDRELLGYIEDEGIPVKERKSSNANSGLFSLDCGVRGQKGTGLTSVLREMGVRQNKHIPRQYMEASIQQRFELLRGLMDTDGSCDKHGTATFCNKSEKLSCDVYELAMSLGLRPRKRKHHGYLPDGRDYEFFQVSFQAYKDCSPFKLKRKHSLCSTGKRFGSLRRIVQSIEDVESIPVSCIQVDSEDGLYLVGRNLVPTHNSVIITQAETIQYHLKHPEHCTGILAYVRPAAKAFLRSIKALLERSGFLKQCFPDILWHKPESQAQKWSEDDGLVWKRESSSRKESTIEAWGLVEGMPTGRHFERMVFDDIETDDIRESPDMLDKVYSKFQMANTNLGTGSDDDVVRIIGTYYSHFGPIVRIGEMKYDNGSPIYTLRVVPGSDNGERDGNPVLMEAKTWEKAKKSVHFASQQLCNPTPISELKLDKNSLVAIEPEKIPRDVYKFMVLDQAGGDETDKQSIDLWSFGVIGVEPCYDDIGQSNIYLLDIEADKMSHSEGINGVVTMYLRNGIIEQMGVEKVGLSTTEIHIANALKIKGRRLSLAGGNLVLLKPAGRSKERRVESALQWPLNNGKIFYSTSIPKQYIEAIQAEMDKFPFYHVDILDMIAYVYDMVKEYHFHHHYDTEQYQNYDYDYADTGRSAIGGY